MAKPSQTADAGEPLFRPAIDAATIRAAAASRPLKPYESLEMNPVAKDETLRQRCEYLAAAGWRRSGGTIELEPPMPWLELPRNAAFDLHSWKPLTLLLSGHSLLGERRFFDIAYAVVADWLDNFHEATRAVATLGELDGFIGQKEDFVWYDMSVGQRAYRLAYALDVRARDEDASDAELERLAKNLYFHLEALTRERFFRGHNNHGLYQALGQLAAARRFEGLPGMARYEEIAEARLETMVREHFFESGPHREHSPGYHYMLLGSLVGARSSQVLTNFYFLQTLERLEEALAWMVLPNGTIAPLGDTDPVTVLRPPVLAEQYSNPELKHLLTGGRDGREPEPGLKAYADAGYAFARLKGEDGGWSYLAQAAAYHSRMHKQADDLGFIWWDRGRDVLVDPGRYAFAGKTERGSELFEQGFWYSDPKRIYVETTRAHNTVEIDERNYVRIGERPHGSFLVQADEQDGMAVVESYVTHFGSVRHRRLLVLNPGDFLLVLDWLSDKDGKAHDFSQRFHVGADWSVIGPGGGRILGQAEDGVLFNVVELLGGAELTPVAHGQTEPELLGWRAIDANKLQPVSTFAYERRGVDDARFATLFTFADNVTLPPGAQQVSPSLTTARFSWIEDGRRRGLSIRRGSGQPTVVAREG